MKNFKNYCDNSVIQAFIDKDICFNSSSREKKCSHEYRMETCRLSL